MGSVSVSTPSVYTDLYIRELNLGYGLTSLSWSSFRICQLCQFVMKEVFRLFKEPPPEPAANVVLLKQGVVNVRLDEVCWLASLSYCRGQKNNSKLPIQNLSTNLHKVMCCKGSLNLKK